MIEHIIKTNKKKHILQKTKLNMHEDFKFTFTSLSHKLFSSGSPSIVETIRAP